MRWKWLTKPRWYVALLALARVGAFFAWPIRYYESGAGTFLMAITIENSDDPAKKRTEILGVAKAEYFQHPRELSEEWRRQEKATGGVVAVGNLGDKAFWVGDPIDAKSVLWFRKYNLKFELDPSDFTASDDPYPSSPTLDRWIATTEDYARNTERAIDADEVSRLPYRRIPRLHYYCKQPVQKFIRETKMKWEGWRAP